MTQVRRYAPTAIAICLALSISAAQPLTAQPIEPVLETPIKVGDVTSSSASLQVTTTLDLACVVVYGTNESFGRLALDQDMGGSAHREHFVIMRGLEPDTEYLYRVQGSAPDGTFYASAVLSFRTLPAEGELDLGTNVASLDQGTRVVGVSSEYSESFRAEYALDGDPATEWSSRGDGNDAFIELPKRVNVTGFGLWTRTMGSSAEIRRFEVTNEDGDSLGPFEVPNASGIYRFEAAGEGQRFTFRVLDSSGGNTGVVELEIFVAKE